MKNFLRRLCVLALTVALVLPGVPMTAYADAGDEPDHSKVVTADKDGGYTIALDVTGDSEKAVTKVNVVVVLDSSGSMTTNTGNTEVTYNPTNQNRVNNVYGLVDGEYVELHVEVSGNWFSGFTFTYYYPWTGSASTSTEYTGQRYTRQTSNQSRMEAASDAVNDLAEALLSNNGGDNPDDTVEMVLVDFDTHASQKTVRTDATRFATDVASADPEGGTNWEAALTTAKSALNQDGEKTYIIFVSDGNPTFRDSQFNDSWNDYRNQDRVYGDGQENTTHSDGTTNVSRCYDAAKAVTDTITSDDDYVLYTIGIYGNVDRMEGLGGTYYSAEDTAALQEALNKIWEDIILSGIGAVEINDGTTTSLSSGDYDLSLITVDESSYKYYRSGGAYSTAGAYGEEWVADEDGENGPPPAEFKDDAVNWDLSSVGVLEDGVTYAVTFKVWPSQQALDLVADIKNDPSVYDDIPEDLQKYIDKNGNILTNTGATVSYTDTRTGETTTSAFEDPDPVGTSSVQSMIISKEWKNDLDDRKKEKVTIYIDRDDDPKHFSFELGGEDGAWEKTVAISVGVLTVDKETGKVEVKAAGHDFSFSEDSKLEYYWEINAPTVHPMLINGTATNLILLEDDELPEGMASDAYYYAEDGEEYYRLTSGGAIYRAEEIKEGAAASLKAVNERRSFFDLTKAVEGNAPEDALFTFKITVDDPREGADDVWFSVKDGTGDGAQRVMDLEASGATAEVKDGSETGYWYFEDGGTATVKMQAGWNLRITNIKSDTEITVEEVLEGGYTVKSMEFMASGELVTESALESNTVTIEDTNTDYTMTYTNEYALGSVTINKTVEGIDISEISTDAAFTIKNEAEDFTTTVAFSLFESNTKDGATRSYTIYDVPFGTYTIDEDGFDVGDYKLETEGLGEEKEVTPTASAVFDVTNSYELYKVNLSLFKQYRGAEMPEDAVFTIAQTSGSGAELFTTEVAFSEFDEDGYYELEVPAGSYEISETDAEVPGYDLSTEYMIEIGEEVTGPAVYEDAVEAEFEPGTYARVYFYNSYTLQTSDLTISKTVEGLGEDADIPTFWFEVIADGEEEEIVTKASITPTEVGKAETVVIPGLAPATYTVREIEPDEIEGYALTELPEEVEVTVDGENAAIAEFVNEYEATTGTVTIAKQVIGAELGDLPDDITFILTGPRGTEEILFSEFDEEGVYTLENMPIGTYTIQEVASSAAIPGLELTSVDYNKEEAELEGGDEINFVVTNAYDTETATIIITKKFKGGPKSADKASFSVEGDDFSDSKTYGEFEDGKWELIVPTGEYTVTEDESTAKVSGYNFVEVKYSTGQTFTLAADQVFEIEITNVYEKKDTPTPPVLDTENHDAYIIGYPDGTVQPEGNITRAEVVTIFFRLLTDKSRSQYWETDNDFDDVNAENWFNNAVSTMANAGIIKGYEDGKFRPYNDVTRAELATMAARFLSDTKGKSESANLSDIEDSWAKEEIELAARYGIVNGYDDGTFKPNQAITRAEAMTLINRLLKRNPHEDHLLKNMVTWPDNSDKTVWYYAQVQEATNSHTYTWGSNGRGEYEYWKALRQNRDWSKLETEWADANSGK